MFDINETIINLGKRLQEARLLRNITQEELAEKCNVTPKHISAIEIGATTGSISLLINICNQLDITPNNLLTDSFDKNISNSIIPINKHEVIIKYSKLSKNNQNYVDFTIEHLFNEQTRKN